MLTMQKLFVLTILLLLITATNVQGSWSPEAGEISYQIDKLTWDSTEVSEI